ncbi:MAG: AmmeMemoRadiSam system protein A [Candidatus Caenarcaniphilales bacterium]|nr:AmmeMemoRadiSam system protein A [Candidatus Caenarcaniphilales bacterium]
MTENITQKLKLGNGELYPTDPSDLKLLLENYYQQAHQEKTRHLTNPLVSLIVPEGSLADIGEASALAYSTINLHATKEIILIAPLKRAFQSGVFTTESKSVETPLGTSPRHTIEVGAGFLLDDAHFENSALEQQLLLLQYYLEKAGLSLEEHPITLLLYHDISPSKLAHKLNQLITPRKTLLVICNQLADHDQTKEADETLNIILESNNDAEAILDTDASAKTAIAAFLQSRQARFAQPELLYCKVPANPRRKEIYASVAYARGLTGGTDPSAGIKSLNLHLNWEQSLHPSIRQSILAQLRGFLMEYLKDGSVPDISSLALDYNLLNQEGACFVSLFKGDKLRGQEGSIFPYRALHLDLVANCLRAAIEDPHFEELKLEELSEIKIKVSILDKIQFIRAKSSFQLLDRIVSGKHGLILQQNNHRTVMFTDQWSKVRDKLDFLSKLCRKAGLSQDAWMNPKNKLQFFSFETIDFAE